jgi:hypothetical protein
VRQGSGPPPQLCLRATPQPPHGTGLPCPLHPSIAAAGFVCRAPLSATPSVPLQPLPPPPLPSGTPPPAGPRCRWRAAAGSPWSPCCAAAGGSGRAGQVTRLEAPAHPGPSPAPPALHTRGAWLPRDPLWLAPSHEPGPAPAHALLLALRSLAPFSSSYLYLDQPTMRATGGEASGLISSRSSLAASASAWA